MFTVCKYENEVTALDESHRLSTLSTKGCLYKKPTNNRLLIILENNTSFILKLKLHFRKHVRNNINASFLNSFFFFLHCIFFMR